MLRFSLANFGVFCYATFFAARRSKRKRWSRTTITTQRAGSTTIPSDTCLEKWYRYPAVSKKKRDVLHSTHVTHVNLLLTLPSLLVCFNLQVSIHFIISSSADSHNERFGTNFALVLLLSCFLFWFQTTTSQFEVYYIIYTIYTVYCGHMRIGS